MPDENFDNIPNKNDTSPAKMNDEFIPHDAWPVCPKCLKPCNPLQNYCNNCGSNQVINPLATYIPFVNIRFNYDIFLTMWRKIWYEKDTSITNRLFYLFMITMCVPSLLIIGLPSFLLFRTYQSKLRKVTIIALFIITIILFALFLRYGLFTGLRTVPIAIRR